MGLTGRTSCATLPVSFLLELLSLATKAFGDLDVELIEPDGPLRFREIGSFLDARTVERHESSVRAGTEDGGGF